MSDTPISSSAPAATATPAGESAPPANMTGAEALAFVQAQKAAKLSGSKSGQLPVAAPKAKEAPKVDPVKEAAQEAARKYKVKIDGQELEVDEQELIRGYGHQKAANKKLQDGLNARKQAEEFISMMKDPEKFYETAKKLGHNPRELAEKYLVSQLQDEMLDPRDKELRDTKAKLKHIEDMEAQQQKAIESARNEALKAKFAKDYSDQFVSALQESGLPPTKPMVAEMAKYIARSAKLGFKMTAIEASKLVKEDVMEAQRRLIGDTDGETLMKLLGDEVANKIRKYDVAKLKNPESNLRTPAEQSAPRPRQKDSGKRMTPSEWRKYNRGS